MVKEYIIKNLLNNVTHNEERVEIGCASCKHKKLEMCDEPCLSCIGYYSKWEQSIDNNG